MTRLRLPIGATGRVEALAIAFLLSGQGRGFAPTSDLRRSKMRISGHFAQVIWKKTRHAGFGMAKSVDGRRAFVVGRYKPRGSRRAYWQEQVPPPTDNKVYIPTSEEMVELYKEAMAEKSEDKESCEDYVKRILEALNSIRVEKKLSPLLLHSVSSFYSPLPSISSLF
ncbi:unnamed protein product [Hydatigera taeniaeformis]|uniref:SCP domain-containing protein n=1 Tax=Hydatigena taeniaeformis TaxID=6205 RepID=A0A0R3WX74_HYDTA|nr:unnamed protein product [Hydatigera taeniaeformis]